MLRTAGFQFEPEMVAVKPESARHHDTGQAGDRLRLPDAPVARAEAEPREIGVRDKRRHDRAGHVIHGGQGGTSSLLELARSHAQLGSQLQQALDQTSDETDPHIVEYHRALRRLIDPLAKATEALFQTKRPKPCTQEPPGPRSLERMSQRCESTATQSSCAHIGCARGREDGRANVLLISYRAQCIHVSQVSARFEIRAMWVMYNPHMWPQVCVCVQFI